MALKTILALTSLAVAVVAAPSPRAVCSGGRVASNAVVCHASYRLVLDRELKYLPVLQVV